MSPQGSAGTAYLVAPDGGPGPGVLVLHSWWGLTAGTRKRCDDLADAGYTALAPNMLPGRLPIIAAEAELELAETDPNETAALLLSSVVALRAHSADPEAPVAVVGYSMGASWALWLAARNPLSVRAAVSYYGFQDIDFVDARAAFQVHVAEHDALMTEDQADEMEGHLRLLHDDVEFHRYPGTRHWFAEEEQVDFFDAEASALAWRRTLAFLAAFNP